MGVMDIPGNYAVLNLASLPGGQKMLLVFWKCSKYLLARRGKQEVRGYAIAS
jgi:hypothetical protein